jgi:site-specific recombinase XerD
MRSMRPNGLPSLKRSSVISSPGHDTRAIQERLGHRNIRHTTRYTELTTHRFKDVWQRED